MMHSKALLFGDEETASAVLLAESPREQKKLGRNVRNFDARIWEMFREGIVFTGNYEKFSQNADLLEALMATRGTTLVEASPYDTVWGIGLKADDPRAASRKTWLGLNLLGEVLTRVRRSLGEE